jgi:epoxyqueuosine reductase
MRCGSVVARFSTPPTPRPYTDHREYCLFVTEGTCGKCIGRCPAGAISAKGHDKLKCQAYLEDTIAKHAKEAYGLEAYGCGLCQTGVPCEFKVPTGKSGRKQKV